MDDGAVRRAVAQTVAAQRLEGWQPTDGQCAELEVLARGELGFGEYLAGHRTRYPQPVPPPRRWFPSRRKPYLLPGTTLLRNNFGATEQAMLTDLEFIATAGRILSWQQRVCSGSVLADDLDVRTIHRHVFADVYSWAGEYRITELRRGDSGFAWQADIEGEMQAVTDRAHSLVSQRPADEPALAYELSRLYADYNHVHPFREGNGRTGSQWLHTISALCGYRLDLSGVSRADWYAASRDSMPFRRDGRANHRPFLPLLGRAVGH